MRRPLLRQAAVLAALLLGIGLAPAASAAVTYPATPPNFARTGGPLYNPAGASRARPVLILYTQYTDIAAPTNQSAATIARNYFGPGFPNALDYLRENSFGRLSFSAAPESEGTANDGVVAINVGTSAAFRAMSEEDQRKLSLQKADPFVNFAPFDSNADNALTDDELTVVSYVVASPGFSGCGATRSVSPVVLDGKQLSSLDPAGSVTDTNLITQIHELGHAMFDAPDLYAWNIYAYDTFSTTCSATSPVWNFGAWNKMNLGWISPTVVTRDGYYDVPRADRNPTAFILYDPEKGTNDYFMVENRQRSGAQYDQNATDSGLVIWRADNSVPFQGPGCCANVAIEVVGADASGSAWDSSDSATPNRVFTSTWRDGTPAKVAVRAIPGSADVMRTYFDVRGPGILVEAAASIATVTIAQANAVSFPVTNTGEESAGFEFTLADLPAGWTVAAQTQTLAAAASGTATVQLTVPADTPTGQYTLQAVGISTADSGVTSRWPITVDVVKRASTLAYTGATDADYSDPAVVSARLTDNLSGAGVAGKSVSFTLGSQNATAVTGADGVATASIVVNQPAAQTTVEASFAGDGTYLASGEGTGFRIDKETLTFAYTGDTLLGLGTTPRLAATATQEADGSAGDLSLATADFALTPTLTSKPFVFAGAVGADGTTSAAATGLPVDIWSVAVSVPAANGYWQGASAAPGELVLFDPAGKSTGDAAGRDSAAAPVRVVYTAQYDGARPKGNATVTFSGGTFTGRSLAWIIEVGNQAVMQYGGRVGTANATLRLRVADNAEPGRPDTFRVLLPGYDSGVVTATTGNIQAH
jgi:M6 family metalloprotease-like protein